MPRGFQGEKMIKQTRGFFTRYILKFLIFSFSFFILSACGYKPVSHYTRVLIQNPLYLEVTLSRKDPDSGVFLKDAMREAVQYRLGHRISSDPHLPNRLHVSYRVVSFDALSYDTNGYVARYRVNLETHFDLLAEGKHIVRKIYTTHEADVTPSALESSKAKREAIKACAVKAVDQFIAFTATYAVQR